MNIRYERQLALDGFGEEAQRRLSAAKVLVVGAGGVGCALLPLLAGAGVGSISIVDFDCVSLSNLARQTLYTQEQIGGAKAPLAAERLGKINPEIKVVAHNKKIEKPADLSGLLPGIDMCIDATDSFASRLIVSDACADASVDEILCSAEGFVSQMFLLGRGVKFSDIVGDDAARSQPAKKNPIFGPAAHLSGVWGAAAALQILSGIRDFIPGFVQSYDFSDNKFLSFTITADESYQIE